MMEHWPTTVGATGEYYGASGGGLRYTTVDVTVKWGLSVFTEIQYGERWRPAGFTLSESLKRHFLDSVLGSTLPRHSQPTDPRRRSAQAMHCAPRRRRRINTARGVRRPVGVMPRCVGTAFFRTSSWGFVTTVDGGDPGSPLRWFSVDRWGPTARTESDGGGAGAPTRV